MARWIKDQSKKATKFNLFYLIYTKFNLIYLIYTKFYLIYLIYTRFSLWVGPNNITTPFGPLSYNCGNIFHAFGNILEQIYGPSSGLQNLDKLKR